MTKEERKAIRNAIADYLQAEGCSCCRSEEAHAEAKARIAKLLRVPGDGEGYFDFNKFSTKPIK